MKLKLAPLPYEKNALEPHISARTLEFHYGKHHQAYMTKLEGAIKDKPEAGKSLEEIVSSSSGFVFNQAAQVWNHSFYWLCMSPDGGGEPGGDLADALKRDFGSVKDFKQAFAESANAHFGSGWTWLMMDSNGKLSVESRTNAENPLQSGQIPLLTLDVWEHAFYLDYQNDKPGYTQRFLDELVNWEFAAQNMSNGASSGVEGIALKEYRD